MDVQEKQTMKNEAERKAVGLCPGSRGDESVLGRREEAEGRGVGRMRGEEGDFYYKVKQKEYISTFTFP